MPAEHRDELETPGLSTARAWAALAESIAQCQHAVRAAIARSARQAGLSEAQFALLWACGASPTGLSQNELAARIGLSAAHISGLVEQLNSRRLIDGQRAATDRRRQVWRLSNTGRGALAGVLVEIETWASPVDGRLGSEARSRIDADLRLLVDSLTDAVQAPRANIAPKPTRTRRRQLAVWAEPDRDAPTKGGGA